MGFAEPAPIPVSCLAIKLNAQSLGRFGLIGSPFDPTRAIDNIIISSTKNNIKARYHSWHCGCSRQFWSHRPGISSLAEFQAKELL